MVALAGVFGGYLLLRPNPTGNAVIEKPAINSLAVLPFENSNPDTEYISDGIAESLINSVSNLPNLRVISRATAFGFKGKNETTQAIGKDLNVQAVLTGKFSQQGDAVTIQADLINIADNSQIWGQRFNAKASELLQVQEQIAKQIADKLQIKLDTQQKARIAKHYTENPEAYSEYLKGRFYTLQYSLDGHKKALEHLNKAVGIDPTYALAYAGIADAYTTASDWQLPPRDALAKAKAAAQKALDLDDKLAEAWAAHGHARLHEWDRSAIDDLNKAVELSPNSLTTQLWLGEYYMIWDLEKSVGILEKASELDPLSPIPAAFLGFDYYMLRQPQKTLEYGKKAVELNPEFYAEHTYAARYYSSIGDFRSAFDELNQIPPEMTDGQAISVKGIVYALQGKRPEAEKAIADLQKMASAQYVSPFEFSGVYNALGDRDKTFFYLEKAFDDGSENVGFIRTMPDFDGIRGDPRYADLMHRAGL